MDQPPAESPTTTPVPAPPPGWVQPAATNTLAIVSLGAGIASFVFAPFVGGLIAIVTGHMAKAEIKRTGEAGSSYATVGLILGYVHMALFAIVVGFVVIVLGGLGLFFATHSH
jgi:hypothetical protein